jgi:site-specific DNA recombinase
VVKVLDVGFVYQSKLRFAERNRPGCHRHPLERSAVRSAVVDDRHSVGQSNAVPESLRRVRCASYTRKPTEEGLEQAFNSLDAQREAAEPYIQSQKHVGRTLVETRFDDGGFSGGNVECPALQQLLEHIDARQVDWVLVYKVDRLSRSLLDFARLMDRFDQRSVSFVSVTQQVNETTSLGRLTPNFLSFAQFEREIISERTRDKMGAARRIGKWWEARRCSVAVSLRPAEVNSELQ